MTMKSTRVSKPAMKATTVFWMILASSTVLHRTPKAPLLSVSAMATSVQTASHAVKDHIESTVPRKFREPTLPSSGSDNGKELVLKMAPHFEERIHYHVHYEVRKRAHNVKTGCGTFKRSKKIKKDNFVDCGTSSPSQSPMVGPEKTPRESGIVPSAAPSGSSLPTPGNKIAPSDSPTTAESGTDSPAASKSGFPSVAPSPVPTAIDLLDLERNSESPTTMMDDSSLAPTNPNMVSDIAESPTVVESDDAPSASPTVAERERFRYDHHETDDYYDDDASATPSDAPTATMVPERRQRVRYDDHEHDVHHVDDEEEDDDGDDNGEEEVITAKASIDIEGSGMIGKSYWVVGAAVCITAFFGGFATSKICSYLNHRKDTNGRKKGKHKKANATGGASDDDNDSDDEEAGVAPTHSGTQESLASSSVQFSIPDSDSSIRSNVLVDDWSVSVLSWTPRDSDDQPEAIEVGPRSHRPTTTAAAVVGSTARVTEANDEIEIEFVDGDLEGYPNVYGDDDDEDEERDDKENRSPLFEIIDLSPSRRVGSF